MRRLESGKKDDLDSTVGCPPTNPGENDPLKSHMFLLDKKQELYSGRVCDYETGEVKKDGLWEYWFCKRNCFMLRLTLSCTLLGTIRNITQRRRWDSL